MATLPGKTDRYRPSDPTWQPASYYGGFMPNVVADQTVGKSPFYPSSVVDKTFAALGPLEPQGQLVASIRPNWTMPTWNSALAYNKGPDTAALNPAVVAATNPATPSANVTASMMPRTGGGLLDLIFGPSKNGLSGLAGLLGGPNAGGILGAVTSQQRGAPTRVTGDALIARATGATSSAENQAWRQKTYGGDGYAMGGS